MSRPLYNLIALVNRLAIANRRRRGFVEIHAIPTPADCPVLIGIWERFSDGTNAGLWAYLTAKDIAAAVLE